MTQSLSNVQNGVLTRRQRRGGQQRQEGQVGQPISEVNATELIAQNPHQNGVIPSLEVSSGPTQHYFNIGIYKRVLFLL